MSVHRATIEIVKHIYEDDFKQKLLEHGATVIPTDDWNLIKSIVGEYPEVLGRLQETGMNIVQFEGWED